MHDQASSRHKLAGIVVIIGKEKPPPQVEISIRAFRSCIRPPGQPIRNVGNVTSRRTGRFAEVSRRRKVATVVVPRSTVGIAVIVETLDQSSSGLSALRAVLDHVVDGLVRVTRVVRRAVVGLHETWVGDGVGGTAYTNAPSGLEMKSARSRHAPCQSGGIPLAEWWQG